MKLVFLRNLIRDTKRLKIIIICALVLLESTVLIGAAFDPVPSASIGIIGGADGPTSVYISGVGSKKLQKLINDLLTRNADEPYRPDNEEPGREEVPGAEKPIEQEERDNTGADLPEATEQQRKEAAEKGLLILINKQNPVDKDYKPEDLVPIEKYYAADRSKAARYMRKEAAQQFYKLVEAAAEEGYELVMTTAYRSYDFQQILWNNYVANEGEAAASRFSARPGQSEHQSGLAVDVSSPSVDYSLTETFCKTEEGIWLAQNAHRFGFIIRFPEGKESITGYLYEPWHIRYVGEPVATEIYAKDLTLEEYLELYGLI
ncbi:MAG TPA: D-alanyl-D-alanine carboxypeptidase family protein [Bacillota bacterium]|jgi:D-alanyl-D-alanine carboxypeptidase|nr:peptidase M15 [Clostridiales bacterium UBA9856]HPZ60182.1 D-alanyl-D-alanine carboxypeptidase family protein [Bacillota bacterium]HQC81814.1 D-alanyl-D-alanine carboxypeptidase family protein [Bacillota bacterium]